MSKKIPGFAIVRKRIGSGNGYDVLIGIDGKKGKRIYVSFSNSLVNKITRTEYITPYLDLNAFRLYFGEGNRTNGFKLGINGKHVKRISFCIPSETNIHEQFVGKYNLLFDSDCEAYYVDLLSKKEN